MENKRKAHYVVGLGEVGEPLYLNIKEFEPCVGLDIDTPTPIEACDVMHVCIGQKDDKFAEIVVSYVERFSPRLLIINSTVKPGTCEKIAGLVDIPVAHSPIRGKHVRMKEDQRLYDKFVGGVTEEAGELAEEHLKNVGFRVRRLKNATTTELAKISCTSYFGVLIAWAQEVERYCDEFDLDYDEVISIYEEVPYFPTAKFFSGEIGGHCVIPNIKLLQQVTTGPLVQAVLDSNALKVTREQGEGDLKKAQ